MKLTILISLLFFYPIAQVLENNLSCQVKDSLVTSATTKENSGDKVRDIFQKVEKGIKTGKIDEYEKEMDNLVSITIGPNEHGYYSTNQALSILHGYFAERRPVSFGFSKIHETGTSPYATGRFVYLQKGIRESAQVYVSLTFQDSIWVIGQFNIY